MLASGQRITETDVSFNNRYTWNTNGSSYDVQAVWAHEAGHTLGLHHTEITGSPRPTMYASYFGTDGRSLESDDQNGLNCAYNRYPPSGNNIASGASEAASRPVVTATENLELAARPRPGGALIRYSLPIGGHVRLDVFDVAGRRLTTLVEGFRAAGDHELAWDGTSAAGRSASGFYFARLVTTAGRATATVALAE